MIRVGTKIYPNTAKDKLAPAPTPKAKPVAKPKKGKANG